MRKRVPERVLKREVAEPLNIVHVVCRAEGQGSVDLRRGAVGGLGIAVEGLRPAPIVAAVVEPRIRHERGTPVAVHLSPPGPVGIRPDGRPSARAIAVAERSAKLTGGEAAMDPPSVDRKSTRLNS